MKIWSTLLLASSTCLVDAFPALSARNLEGLTPEKLRGALGEVEKLRKDKRFLLDILKPIGSTGEHGFVPPSANDQRGPCPGLNALANHKYIAHDGITSFAEVVTAINKVFGMGLELSLILGIMGTVWTGNPLSLNPGFSIGGGGNDNLLGNVLGLVGDPRGLQGSHNWIESDASLTRDDLYLTGNAWTMNMTLFLDLYNRADANGVISMDLLGDQAARRWAHSVAHNPDFYYGPITGMVSRNAGYFFLGRLLANHSDEHPGGILTQDVFKKFFGVFEDGKGRLQYREGHESFPDNWFRIKGEYGLLPLNVDIVRWVSQHPELGSIGGNTGKVNSFTGLSISNTTNGLLNSATLLENNNLMCFALQVLKTFLPNSLAPLLRTLEVPISMVTDVLAAPLLSLACPAWGDMTQGGEPLWDVLQETFSGARKSGSSL